MKNFNDIQALLDRYWEGETTLEEERTLKTYFASGDVDQRLQAYAPLFRALREEQVLQAANSYSSFELPVNVVQAKAKIAPLTPVHFSWQRLAAAASVALLLAAGLWWATDTEKPVQEQVAQQPTVQPQQIVPQNNPDAEEHKITAKDKNQPPVLAKKTYVKRKKPPTAKPVAPETEQAMEEILAALALVSSKIKKGKQEAAKGTIHLESMDKVFKKKSEG